MSEPTLAYTQWQDDGERDRTLLEQMPQVHYIARRIHERLPRHVPIEDLVHAGVLGLMDALHKFDHTRHVQFSSYAKFRIRGAILDSLRELDWSPRDLRRKARQIEEVHQRLHGTLGRTPTEPEMAAELGLELRQFQALLTELKGLFLANNRLSSLPPEIGRLTALNEDSPAADIRKTISETDAAWRKAGEIPRHLAAKFDAKFRTARDRARDLVAGGAKRSWAKVCDALESKLALCAAMASGSATNIDEDWAALAVLPAAWEAALLARRQAGASGADVGEVMLKLEAALEIDSPPAFQAARREMKLRAMKQAIEARQAVVVSAADISGWVAVAISHPSDSAASAARLQAIITALRARPL